MFSYKMSALPNVRNTNRISWRTGTLDRLFPVIFQNDAAPDQALTSF